MTFSRRFSFLVLAASALIASATYVIEDRWRERIDRSIERLHAAVVSFRDWIVDVVATSWCDLTRTTRAWLALATPAKFQAIEQYVTRQVHRPRIFPGWRMCSST